MWRAKWSSASLWEVGGWCLVRSCVALDRTLPNTIPVQCQGRNSLQQPARAREGSRCRNTTLFAACPLPLSVVNTGSVFIKLRSYCSVIPLRMTVGTPKSLIPGCLQPFMVSPQLMPRQGLCKCWLWPGAVPQVLLCQTTAIWAEPCSLHKAEAAARGSFAGVFFLPQKAGALAACYMALRHGVLRCASNDHSGGNVQCPRGICGAAEHPPSLLDICAFQAGLPRCPSSLTAANAVLLKTACLFSFPCSSSWLGCFAVRIITEKVLYITSIMKSPHPTHPCVKPGTRADVKKFGEAAQPCLGTNHLHRGIASLVPMKTRSGSDFCLLWPRRI